MVEKPNLQHGHRPRAGATATYKSWMRMKARCHNPRNIGWKDYGGRGICVCPQWQRFEGFLTDMGERPTGTTLERINVDGDYELANCRWATPLEQGANRRPRKLLSEYTEEELLMELVRRCRENRGYRELIELLK
jgi:hypothetical protein